MGRMRGTLEAVMRWLHFGCIVLSVSLAVPKAAWGQTVCRPADATTQALILDVGRYTSATTGDNKVVRDSLRLPSLSPGQITVVTQETVCKKASSAFQSYWANRGGTAFSGRVYVLQIGSVYGVTDPSYRYRAANPDTPLLFLDSRYKALSVY
jgi:hypothetical protein